VSYAIAMRTMDESLKARVMTEDHISVEIRGILCGIERTLHTLRDAEATRRHGGKDLLVAKNERRLERLTAIVEQRGAGRVISARNLQHDLNAYYLANGMPGNVREVGR